MIPFQEWYQNTQRIRFKMAEIQELIKMFSEISRANPDANVTLHPDGKITMRLRKQIETAPVEEPVPYKEQELMPRRKWVRRKKDPEFDALSEEDKHTKLREETYAPIDVSQEGLEYLHSLGGNGRKSPRNLFINTMYHLNRVQKAGLQTSIRQLDLVKNKKVMDKIKSEVNGV